MEEFLEVMCIDGSVVEFKATDFKSAERKVRSEIRDYIKEVHGAVLYTVFNSDNEEFVAIDTTRDCVISPIVYITPLLR